MKETHQTNGSHKMNISKIEKSQIESHITENGNQKGKTMICYKLTNQNLQTYGGCK